MTRPFLQTDKRTMLPGLLNMATTEVHGFTASYATREYPQPDALVQPIQAPAATRVDSFLFRSGQARS